MNNKAIIESALVSQEELWWSRRVLSASADNAHLNLHNSS